jgi:hypothetical protein
MFNAAPMSAQDVAALQARRQVLSEQLTSTDGRRRELARLARRASGADKAGLEQRIGVLDARLARLESDIDETGKLLASAPAALASTHSAPTFSFKGNGAPMPMPIPIIAILSIFVLSPIAISVARVIWRRGSLPRAAGPDRESAKRLERMEQAIDSIAIEMERVSEGQRFITRLLSERRPGDALDAGQPAADPGRLPVGGTARI